METRRSETRVCFTYARHELLSWCDMLKAVVLLLLAVIAVACSGNANQGGAGGEGSLHVTYADSTLSNFGPGQPVIVVVTGGDETSPYTGMLGSTPLSLLMRDDGSLTFRVPPIDPGTHTLTIANGRARGSLPLEVGYYTPIDDPLAFITDQATAADAGLRALLAKETAADARAALQEDLANLASVMTNLPLAPADEQVLLAYALRDLSMHRGAFAARPLNVTACPHMASYASAVIATAYFAGVTAIGVFTAPVWLGVGAAVAVFGAWHLKDAWTGLMEERDKVLKDCVELSSTTISEPSFVAGGLVFMHGVPKTLQVSSTWDIPADIADMLDDTATTAAGWTAIPQSWLDKLDGNDQPILKGVPEGLYVELCCSDQLNLVITDLQTTATTITLTFSFLLPLQRWDYAFDFWVVPGSSILQPATLKPVCSEPLTACPTAPCGGLNCQFVRESCRDLQTAETDCGACDSHCDIVNSLGVCQSGVCVCPPGMTAVAVPSGVECM